MVFSKTCRTRESLLSIPADMVVLAAGIRPPASNGELSQMLKVPLNANGFFLEAHMKLRPVDFASEGIFLAGSAHSPKFISEAISQARPPPEGHRPSWRAAMSNPGGVVAEIVPPASKSAWPASWSIPTTIMMMRNEDKHAAQELHK
jgi:hypothetical protein